MARYRKLEEWMSSKLVTFICGLAFPILIYCEYNDMSILKGYPATLTGLSFFLALGKSIATKHERASQFLSFLGRNSLAIYLVHYFFLFRIPTELFSLVSGARAFTWELMIMLIYTAIVVSLSLVVIYAIRMNEYLAMLLLGEAPKKAKKTEA